MINVLQKVNKKYVNDFGDFGDYEKNQVNFNK